MFRDLQREQTVFSDLAAHRIFPVNVAYRDQTISGQGVQVSGSYFPTLGLVPALGRLLGPEVDEPIGGHPVTVLSHEFWQSHLGGNPGVLGQKITINGQPLSVVGVAPAGFRGTTLGVRPMIFVPIAMRAALFRGFDGFEDRRAYWVYLFARLKPGVSIEQARAALLPLYRGILAEVEAPLQVNMSEQTMARFVSKPIPVEDGRHGESWMDEEAGGPLILLFGVTGIIVLIACANIANLLLARSAARAPEMAVRLSIGASRGQLLAQLLTESCLLALVGGMAGLLVARWTLGLIRSIPGLVARLDPNLPVDALKTLPQQVEESASLDHLITTLSAGFALLATLLAAVGLYGVLAYSVSQRTRDFGLRMALGADAASVGNMVLAQVGWMVLVGGAVGLAAALALGRFAQSLLYEIEGPQPAVILGAVAVLSAVAFGAGYVPARRASRVNPMVALRYE